MADLPIELWHLIFDHLELADLPSCALVNKAVYLAVKEYRIHEIAFTRRVYEWFHYATPTIDHKHRIDFTMASILKRSSFNFDYLRRLKIGRSSAIDLGVINKFTRLEELDLDLANYKNEKSSTLSLANLNVLYLFVPASIPYVELDTPRLANVYTFDLRKLEFLYPDSVRCIHTYYDGGKLPMFRSLEYLTLTDCYNQMDFSYNSRRFDEFCITALKKLKEIHFYYLYTYHRKENMSVIKRMTEKLLALGRPDLKMFWMNVRMTDLSLLSEYKHTWEDAESFLAFQLKHYEILKEKDQFWPYEFNSSMRKLSKAGFKLKGEDFITKLLTKNSFRRIEVNGKVEERELLLEIIARSSDLFYLRFHSSGLDQSFFDQMADTVRLNGIPLRQLHVESSSALNFDFVSGLHDLELFKTDQSLPAELIPKLTRLSLLTKIEFASGQYKLERTSTGTFWLHGESLNWNLGLLAGNL